MTEFKVGDRVEHNGGRTGVLTYGPFSASFSGATSFLMLVDGGDRERTVSAVFLKALPAFAIGDTATHRERTGKIVAGPFESAHGDGTFWILEGDDGKHTFPTEGVLRKLESADTFIYKGVEYEFGTLYRDVDGDHFDFKSELSGLGTPDGQNDGTPQGRWRGTRADDEPNCWAWSLAEVVNHHGPLTKV